MFRIVGAHRAEKMSECAESTEHRGKAKVLHKKDTGFTWEVLSLRHGTLCKTQIIRFGGVCVCVCETALQGRNRMRDSQRRKLLTEYMQS